MKLGEAKQILSRWGGSHRCVQKVWVYGSRVRGDSGEASDFDVALEIDPALYGQFPTLDMFWMFTARRFRAELEPLFPWTLHLECFDRKIDSPNSPVPSGVKRNGVLVYSRDGSPEATPSAPVNSGWP